MEQPIVIDASDIPFMAGYAVVAGDPKTDLYDCQVRGACRVNYLQALVAFIAEGKDSTRTRREIIEFGQKIGSRSVGNANALSYLNPSYGYLKRTPGRPPSYTRNDRPKLFIRVGRGVYGLTETRMNKFQRIATGDRFSMGT